MYVSYFSFALFQDHPILIQLSYHPFSHLSCKNEYKNPITAEV